MVNLLVGIALGYFVLPWLIRVVADRMAGA